MGSARDNIIDSVDNFAKELWKFGKEIIDEFNNSNNDKNTK